MNTKRRFQGRYGIRDRIFIKDKLFSEDFIKDLHIRMFGEVWLWAGSYRRSNKNIEVDWIVSVH